MKKFLLTLGLALSLSAFPFGSAIASDGNTPTCTIVMFEDGTYQRFEGYLTNDQVISVYSKWYEAHPEYGSF